MLIEQFSRHIQSVRRETSRRANLAAALIATTLLRGRAERLLSSEPWLLGSAAGAAYTDNSAALHQYLRRERPDINTLFVLDHRSPDFDRASSFGPVLRLNRTYTYIVALLARVHVISHGVHDVPTCASPRSSALKVRLGHGLTALKKTKPRALHSNASANAVFDLVPVASTFEKSNKRAWHIQDDALVVTGVARFDSLVRLARSLPPRRERHVVYMPTWRDWLPGDPRALRASAFVGGVTAFLSHERLATTLQRYDARLSVVLHPLLRKRLAPVLTSIAHGRVTVCSELDFQPLLASADMLVTDYSSVTWDMLYLGRPIVFYQFDREEYEADRGAYIDMHRELPGPAAVGSGEAVALIDRALSGAWRSDADWTSRAAHWAARAFAYTDDGNCQRIVEAIEGRLEARQRALQKSDSGHAEPLDVDLAVRRGSSSKRSAGTRRYRQQN